MLGGLHTADRRRELPRPLLVALHTRHAIGEVTVYDLATGAPVHDVAVPGRGNGDRAVARRDGPGHEVWFAYTDFTTPTRILRYDARTAGVSVWAEPDGDAGTTVRVVTKHVTYPSYDGTEVRMFVASAADRPDRPGAGDPVRLRRLQHQPAAGLRPVHPRVDRSRRHLRARQPARWQRGGRGLAPRRPAGSQAERLRRLPRGGRLAGRARPDHPRAAGHLRRFQRRPAGRHRAHPAPGEVRRGGLLGAAAGHGPLRTLRPGQQLERRIRHRRRRRLNSSWLYAYSPYHHVQDGTRYPAVIFTVFEGDTRVDPLHARKLCAALQHATSNERPVAIRRERNVGHASRAVSRTVELAADRLAFFATELGAGGAVEQ